MVAFGGNEKPKNQKNMQFSCCLGGYRLAKTEHVQHLVAGSLHERGVVGGPFTIK